MRESKRPPHTLYKRLFNSIIVLSLSMLVLSVTAQDLENKSYFHLAQGRNDILLMQGTINGDTPDQLKTVLNTYPDITTIVMLYCPGSSDDEANIPMARQVRALGLNIHLTASSDIASGCVDFFLAGSQRTMERGAKIGVHSWYDDDDQKDATDYPADSPEHEMNRKYIEDMLGSDAFYWFTINAASADDMYYMTEQEIIQYQLLTQH
jgi:hypothetical protein